MDQIGRYQIVSELGRGAMGIVYQALDPTIGRPVAIKTIRLAEEDPEQRTKLRDRLFREARSAGILSHPGVVTIYDMEAAGELAYIAMEFVNGPTLESVLARKDPLAPQNVLRILCQAASALDYAHGKGIIHRDIKPGNIMLNEAGNVKITDFGIAKLTTTEQYTMTGAILGTPSYMSPEQIQGLSLDGRSDQFSLAVVAYEMLTGERPFSGEHLTTVVYKIVAEQPVSAQRINPTLGAKIEAAVTRGLSKKPEERYACCTAFVDALEQACNASPGWKNLSRGGSLALPTVMETRPMDAAPEANPAAPASTEPPVKAPPPAPQPPALTGRAAASRMFDQDPERSGRRRGWWLPFAGALAVAGVLIALISWQSGPSTAGHETRKPPEQAPSNTPEPAKPVAPAPPDVDQTRPSPLEENHTPAAGSAAVTPEPKKNVPEEKEGESAPASSKARERRTGGSSLPQEIWVPTEPPGATAMLDGRPETACKTPCMMQAAPGRHQITISLRGFQQEYREIEVTNGAQELAPVVMNAEVGTLMLSSIPAGANITVDGKAVLEKTPARLKLMPGQHQVTVDTAGMRRTEQVEIRNGVTNHLRILLE
jgi:serine/threonine protein kinase